MGVFQKIEQLTEGQWFISGSLNCGGFDPRESDIDICVPIWHDSDDFWDGIAEYINTEKSVEQSLYWGGKKVTLKERPEELLVIDSFHSMDLNLIPLHPNSFISWARTTKQMQVWYKDWVSLNQGTRVTKELRILAFESFNSVNAYSTPLIINATKTLDGYQAIWAPLKTLSESTFRNVEVEEIPF